MRTVWIVAVAFSLNACTGSGVLLGPKDTSAGPWRIGFTTPYAMEAWVEEAAAVDAKGHLYRPIFTGYAGDGRSNRAHGPRGWSRGWQASGSGKHLEVQGAQLPLSIYVRWQSLVEPQVYDAWIELPEDTRDLMRKSLTEGCPKFPREWEKIPKRASLVVGLAPGGIVRVWGMDECLNLVHLTRAQAEVVPMGPDLGFPNSSYPPIEERYKAYIKENGIPYGSW